ncbi:glycosyltransferase [Fictibacillus nanhaiensis]|uniref:glycosyltransferase family 2 protein n=1 Tax=Fictibacillus nanhaiensis TaxID=742169 RepID=UPI002E249EE5|nr:glycosyltransferase [Fictibacillus nanhaiensis]
MKFCFVILHYRTLNETIECIQHLKKLKNQHDIQIIVVDNGSNDASIEKIKKQVIEEENLLYVESEYNLGFAKGNNLGYTISKHKYQAEYIFMLNSDVYIKEKEFTELVVEINKQTNFDILGPDIITKNGDHQNPVNYINNDIKLVNKSIMRNRISYFASFLPLGIKELIKKNRIKKDESETCRELVQIEDCPLHGACLIFSENFIKNHEFPFYPDTFLYAEEDILYYLGKKRYEKFVFSPKIKVLHYEDAATDLSFSNQGKKRRFIIKNSNRSLKILKKLMKSNNSL